MRDQADQGIVSRIAARAAGVLALVALSLGLTGPASAQVVDPGSVVQTIETSLWSPPAPDPAGIVYRPDSGDLLTCDSEVDEMSIFAGVNLWAHSHAGVVSSTASTTAYSSEPSGIALDPAGGRIWISDDNRGVIFEIGFGPDGSFGTPDDSNVDLDGLVAAGCARVKDVAYNNLDGHLYVPTGPSQLICEIAPGPNGVFDGAAPTGDDVVSTFSLAPYGITNPEGLTYDPFWNTLVVADRGTRDLYELTPDGGLLRKIDLSFAIGTKLSGVTIAPGSTNPVLRNYWVTDRRVDNGGDPLENDGRIYEIAALPLGGNGAPVVEAGPPQTIEWPANSVELAGTVSDDGHPYPPSQVLSLWSKQSGPGSVAFGSESSPATSATFSAPGDYVLQLVGDDSAAQSADTVAITVTPIATLSVTLVGPGAVTLDPPGGSYTIGQTVNLTATPDPDAAFLGWSGDLSGGASSESIVMDADKSVTASFATLYDVTIESSGPGSVTLDPPGGSYAAGTLVTVTATPGANASFDGFSGDLTGTTSPQLLSVDADKTVSASFTQHHSVSVSMTGPGSVTLDPPGGSYAAGTLVTVTATPGANASFDGFSGDLTGTTSPQLLSVDADKTVSASFTLSSYTLTVTVQGGGTVTLDPPGGIYPAGTLVTLTAAPSSTSWRFGSWSGDVVGTANPALLVMDGAKSVQATFSATGGGGTACGIGPELAALVPALGWLYRRRRAGR